MIVQALVFDLCAEVAIFNYNKLAHMKKGKSFSITRYHLPDISLLGAHFC